VSSVAVLLSAGLDSAVLAAFEARRARVQPIYVSAGLSWETQELQALERLLAAPVFATLAPLARLTFTVRDLYPPTHWALRGEPPAFDTPDEDVYLAGRNIILLSKASIYCAQRRITRIALGPLAGNPFPDATPQFFSAMAQAMSLGLAAVRQSVDQLAAAQQQMTDEIAKLQATEQEILDKVSGPPRPAAAPARKSTPPVASPSSQGSPAR